MIANSTWLAISDETLGLCRLRKIRTAALFDSNPSQLTSYQAGVKSYTAFAHQLMGIRSTEWYAQARIQLPIDANTANATFNLDSGINPDFLVPGSFYNATAGDANARPLPLWSDEQFNNMFPDPTQIVAGPPEAVVLLPLDRGNNLNPVWQVRIYPNPDKQYQLYYKAKINVPQLTQATDQILWPYEYQTVISSYAWMLMEMGLGEGKDSALREVAMKAVNDVKLVGTIAQEARHGIRLFRAQARNHGSSGICYLTDEWTIGDGGIYIKSPPDPIPTQVTAANYWTL